MPKYKIGDTITVAIGTFGGERYTEKVIGFEMYDHMYQEIVCIFSNEEYERDKEKYIDYQYRYILPGQPLNLYFFRHQVIEDSKEED